MLTIVTPTKDQTLIRQLFAAFFGELFRDEELRRGFAGVDKVLEMRYHDPEICFYLDLTGGDARFVDSTGEERRPSDIQVEMAWEVAHEFWKDELDVIMAVISQRIKLTGSSEALLHLRPHFKSASKLYGALSASLGIENTPPVSGMAEPRP